MAKQYSPQAIMSFNEWIQDFYNVLTSVSLIFSIGKVKFFQRETENLNLSHCTDTCRLGAFQFSNTTQICFDNKLCPLYLVSNLLTPTSLSECCRSPLCYDSKRLNFYPWGLELAEWHECSGMPEDEATDKALYAKEPMVLAVFASLGLLMPNGL